jgi:hypothetical protein
LETGWPLFIGLEGHQVLTQPLLGKGTHIVLAIDQLDATRLATATSMNLHFDDPAVAANLLCGSDGLISAVYCIALRDGQSIFGKQLLCLVFVQIHPFSPSQLMESWRVPASLRARLRFTPSGAFTFRASCG